MQNQVLNISVSMFPIPGWKAEGGVNELNFKTAKNFSTARVLDVHNLLLS